MSLIKKALTVYQKRKEDEIMIDILHLLIHVCLKQGDIYQKSMLETLSLLQSQLHLSMYDS